jgi:hypothetical protein
MTGKDGKVYFYGEVSIGSDFVVFTGGSKFPLGALVIPPSVERYSKNSR